MTKQRKDSKATKSGQPEWELVFDVDMEHSLLRRLSAGDALQVAQRLVQARGCLCGHYRIVTDSADGASVQVQHDAGCQARRR